VRIPDIEKIGIPVFTRAEQDAIARILGALDDKIELNRKMNETLEQMARAVFKACFTYPFEGLKWIPLPNPLPVGEGDRRSGEGELQLVDSPRGKIPKGWEVGTVNDLAEVTTGSRPERRRAERGGGFDVPLYGGGGPMAYVERPLLTESTVITGRVGTLGMVFRVTSSCWPSDNTLVMVPRRPEWYEYVYYEVGCIDFESLNRGSTQPLVTQTDLQHWPVLVIPDAVLVAFHGVVSSLLRAVDHNNEQSRTLAAIRDALLPKLMSGEARVA
jgi:type I restriction enzyme S subunit